MVEMAAVAGMDFIIKAGQKKKYPKHKTVPLSQSECKGQAMSKQA